LHGSLPSCACTVTVSGRDSSLIRLVQTIPCLIVFAGIPAATEFSGISDVKTELKPTTLPLPIFEPFKMTALFPIQQ
jgi:hypothetical protein